MNTYEIKNIKTLKSEADEVVSVIFQLFATDPKGEVAEGGRHIAMPEPFETSDKYSDADLLALCEAEVDDKGMKAFLDNILTQRGVVLVDPAQQPPATPAQPDPVPAPPPPTPPTDAEQRTHWFNDIDDRIAGMLGKFTRFQMGYSKRLVAAQAFKDANYVGDPTIWITSFAVAAGVTNQQSADAVLAKAVEYDVGLEKLEDLRMQKYLIMRAATPEDASAAYYDIVARANTVYQGLS